MWARQKHKKVPVYSPQTMTRQKYKRGSVYPPQTPKTKSEKFPSELCVCGKNRMRLSLEVILMSFNAGQCGTDTARPLHLPTTSAKPMPKHVNTTMEVCLQCDTFRCRKATQTRGELMEIKK